MANRFVSASGSNTSPFDTWAKAASSSTTGLTDAIAQMAAGDILWCDKTTTISNSTFQTMTFPGTDGNPNYIFSATNTGTTPVAADIAAGFVCTTTGTTGQTWNGAFYMYGVTVNVGTGTSAVSCTAGSVVGSQYWDNCSVHLKPTGGSGTLNVCTYSGGNRVTFNNVPIEFNTTTSGITSSSGSLFIWQNTPSALTGAAVPAALFLTSIGRIIIDGCDISAVVSGKVLNPGSAIPYSMLIRNCKTSGVSTIYQTPTTRGGLIDAVLSDSSGTTAFQSRRRYEGSIDVSTTVYNNASDGTTSHSWTVVTTANSSRALPFACFEIDQWVNTGTFANSKIFLTSATASLTNADIWVEVDYLGSGATPVASTVTTGTATMFTTGTTLTASSPAWAHGSLGNDYMLQIPSFTTALAGYVRFRIYVAKASLTVNVDPAVTIA